jgi:8-hydroxy-5-deazaflavin:NADPH oxidoreductase
MRIGIVGSGDLAGVLAELWAASGHQIAVGGGHPDSAEQVEAVASVGSISAEDAARFGDIIVLTTGFEGQRMADLPQPITVAGKIVVDAMNAAPFRGEPPDLGERPSSKVTAERFSAARVVKAFNTLAPEILRAQSRRSVPNEQRLALFLSGDDARAKERVSSLIEEIGFAPVDAGSLARGGWMQAPGSRIHGVPMLPAEARRTLSLMG